MFSGRALAKDILNDSIVVTSRYIDMALVMFNVMVALMLLTSPWYLIKHDVTNFPPGSGCQIVKGTAIAPFISEMCDGSQLGDLIDGGDRWVKIHVLCWIFFAVSLLAAAVIGYEVVTHGVRDWKDANTIGFIMQAILIVVQSMILLDSGKAIKPNHADNSTATILTITAISLSSVRAVVLLIFMCVTLRFEPRGVLGTGAFV